MTALNRPGDVDLFVSGDSRPARLTIRFRPLRVDDLQRVLDAPNAVNVRSIYISGDVGDEAMEILAAASNVSGVLDLSVSSSSPGGVTAAGVFAISKARWRLESLNLSRNAEIGDVGLGILARATWLESLKHLQLCSIGATAEGIEQLVAVAAPQLERLALGTEQTRTSDPEDTFGDRGVFAIVRATLPALTHLKLTGAGITDAGAKALADWAGLARITNLDLSRNAITTAGLDALLDSSNAHAIQALGIGSNPCGPSYWTASDYDGSITASGVEDQAALQRVTDYVARRLGRSVDVW